MVVPRKHAGSGTSNSRCNFAAISGLGGTGKTSIAVEYAWLRRGVYSGGCYWLSADDLEGSIRDLGSYVGIFDFHSAASVKHQLSSVLAHLSALPSAWLLIIDNMDLPELPHLLETILLGPFRQLSGYVSLLVTSRCRPDVLRDVLHIESESSIVTLDDFEEIESVAFLKRRTLEIKDRVKFSPADALDLAHKVGHLPLALEQAVAYLLFTPCSLKEYVATYKKQRAKLLKRRSITRTLGDDKSARHRLAVHTTWRMNFERIRNHDEFGECLGSFLEMTAFLAAEKIPVTLLRATDEEKFKNDFTALPFVVSLLTELSLFRKKSDKWITVHRLVQEVLQDSINRESCKLYVTLRSAIKALALCLQSAEKPDLMEQAMSETVGKHEDWGVLSSHAIVLQEHIFSSAHLPSQEFYGLLCSALAELLDNASIYASSIGRQAVAKQLDYQKLCVLDIMDDSLSTCELVRMTSTKIPLSLKVQQNVRRSIVDKTMTGTENSGKISWERQRNVIDSTDTATKMTSFQGQTAWMETLRTCDLRTARDAVIRLSTDLSNLSTMPSKETLYFRFAILSCRARAHLLSGNLDGTVKDANECIRLGPSYSDGYAVLAQVFALIRCSSVPLAQCVAAVAKFLDSECATMAWFEQAYPNVQAVRVATKGHLQRILSNQKSYREQTILLEDFEDTEFVTYMNESLNVVCLRPREVRLAQGICFLSGRHCWVNVSVVLTKGSIASLPLASVCFIHCTFTSTDALDSAVSVRGSAYFDRCHIVNSDAGGLLVGCHLGMATLCYCLVKGNKAAGLEARHGGSLLAIGNTVCENGWGFLVGPIPGHCLAQSNRIFMNKMLAFEVRHLDRNTDPIYACKQVTDYVQSMPFQGVTIPGVVIEENEICDNGTYGISLLYVTSRLGIVSIRKNLINGNMFCGLCSSRCCDPDPIVGVSVSKNVFRGNKCGAIILRSAAINSHRITDNVIDSNLNAFSGIEMVPAVVKEYMECNTVVNNIKTLHYPQDWGVWQASCCSSCHSPIRKQSKSIMYNRCYASVYCSSTCVQKHSTRHGEL